MYEYKVQYVQYVTYSVLQALSGVCSWLTQADTRCHREVRESEDTRAQQPEESTHNKLATIQLHSTVTEHPYRAWTTF